MQSKSGPKDIPDLVLRQVIPHLEVMFPPPRLRAVVKPEDAPNLSFQAGQQSVIEALRSELASRKGVVHG